MSKTCIACGMPMTTPEDFPKSDTTKDYCLYCAHPDGSMQSYEEKLQGYAGWLSSTQGLDKSAALTQARIILLQLPAWKNLSK